MKGKEATGEVLSVKINQAHLEVIFLCYFHLDIVFVTVELFEEKKNCVSIFSD